MEEAKRKTHKLPLIAGVLAVLLGVLGIMTGLMFGGYVYGIPAILLAIYSYKKGHRLLGIVGIILSCIGIAESFVASLFWVCC